MLRLARLAEFGSGRARGDDHHIDDTLLHPRGEPALAAAGPPLQFGQPVLVTCTEESSGRVYRFLCTAAPPAPLFALSIDPSVQQVPSPPPWAAGAPSPQGAAPPPPPSPLDLARALDSGERVSATLRPLHSKVIVATSATVWLLLPPSQPSPPPPSPARALWVAPALEQRLVQAGAVVRPSPLCPYGPACRVVELEPRGVPGQAYRVVASTAVTVLVAAAAPLPADSAAAGEEGQQQQSQRHHLLTASSAGGVLLFDRPGGRSDLHDGKGASSLSRANSSSSSATSNITRRPQQQQQPRAAPAPSSAARAAAGHAAGRPVVSARTAAAAAAAAAASKQRQQRARAPSPSSSSPSSSASPVAASSAFGLLDALGSDD